MLDNPPGAAESVGQPPPAATQCGSGLCAHVITRRAALGVGLAAGVAALAACTSGADSPTPTSAGVTPAGTTTSTSTAAPSSASSAAGSSAADSSTSDSSTASSGTSDSSTASSGAAEPGDLETSATAVPEPEAEDPGTQTAPAPESAQPAPGPSTAQPQPAGENYGALDAIPEGDALIVGPITAPVALARSGSNVVGFSAFCTHQGCTVNARSGQLVCPCHGSKFDPLTGAVLRGPAARPLPAVTIQVVDGTVYAT